MIGYQGQRLDPGSWLGISTPLSASTIHALQEHAPTLGETMRIAGTMQAALFECGADDAMVCEEQVKQKFNLSRMRLECLGLLPVKGPFRG